MFLSIQTVPFLPISLIFALLILPTILGNARIKVPEVHHLKGYRSPLDEGISEMYYDGDKDKPNPADEDFPEDGAEALLGGLGKLGLGIGEEPLCHQECLAKFSGAVKTAMESSSNVERFKGVCQDYNKTIGCMDRLDGERCSNQETFHVFTSGVRYMCIEQKKAFDAVIECIDAQATEVERECEEVCHVKERMAHFAVQSGALDSLMQGALSSLANGETLASQIFGRGSGLGNLIGLQHHRTEWAKAKRAEGNREDNPLLKGVALKAPQGASLSKRITPEFMRAVVQDGCELTRCQLICVRVKFDAKCSGSAGALLSEAFVRPIAQAQEFLTYGHIAPFMGAFLPHQCDFMVKKEVLNEFRIPPELDDALHRKFDGAGGAEGNQRRKGDEKRIVGEVPKGETADGGQAGEGGKVSPSTSPPSIGDEPEPSKADQQKELVEGAGKESSEEAEGMKFDVPMGEGTGRGPGNRIKVSRTVGKANRKKH